jgi:hypothetical protein
MKLGMQSKPKKARAVPEISAARSFCNTKWRRKPHSVLAT